MKTYRLRTFQSEKSWQSVVLANCQIWLTCDCVIRFFFLNKFSFALKIIPEFKLKEEVGFLGSSKYMTIHASCDKGGYVPGEKINVKLKFINNSDKDISAVKIVLEQVGCFIFVVCY